ERWGSKPAVRVGTLFLCAALLGPALAPTYAAFVVLLAALVFFGGFLDVAFNAQAIAVERGYRRPIMSGLHGAWSVGLLVGSGVAASAVTVLATGMAAARLVADRLTMRVGPVRVVRAGSLVAAVGFGLATVIARTPAALVGFALLGAGVGAVVPTVFS